MGKGKHNYQFKTVDEVEKALTAGKLTPDQAAKIKRAILAKKDKQDISWYNHFPKLMENVGLKSWNHLGGTSLDPIGAAANNRVIPTLSVLKQLYVPTPGICNEESDAFNTMCRSMYLAMHRKYRGQPPYQRADIGITLFGLLDAFRNIAEAERIYGILNYYSVLNRSIPDVLGEALGIDVQQFDDIADFRYRLNRLILKCGTLCLPAGFSYLDRQLALTSLIFKDSESHRAAIMFYDCPGFWLYQPALIPTGGCLQFKAYKHSAMHHRYTNVAVRSPDDIIDDLTEQLNALLEDDDITKITSDILAIYGDNKEDSPNIVRQTLIPEDYSVRPEKKDDWLLQFHNTCDFGNFVCDNNTLLPKSCGTQLFKVNPNLTSLNIPNSLYIYQVGNVVQFNAFTASSGAAGYSDIFATWPSTYSIYRFESATGDVLYGRTNAIAATDMMNTRVLLDTWKENPGVDDVMEMTRNVCLADANVTAYSGTDIGGAPFTANALNLATCGSELFFQVIAYSTDKATSDNRSGFVSANQIYGSGFSGQELYLQFDWNRLVYNNSGNPTSYYPLTVWGDIDNPCSINLIDVQRAHDCAIMSEFDSPILKGILQE